MAAQSLLSASPPSSLTKRMASGDRGFRHSKAHLSKPEQDGNFIALCYLQRSLLWPLHCTGATGLCCVAWLNPVSQVSCTSVQSDWLQGRAQSLARLLPLDDNGMSQLQVWYHLLICKDRIQSLPGYSRDFQQGKASLLGNHKLSQLFLHKMQETICSP